MMFDAKLKFPKNYNNLNVNNISFDHCTMIANYQVFYTCMLIVAYAL